MSTVWTKVKKIAKSNLAPVVNPLAPLTPVTTTAKVTTAASNLTSQAVNALPVSSTVKKVLDPVSTVKKVSPDLSLSQTSAGKAAAEAAKRKAEAEKAELEKKKLAAASRNVGLKLASASASKAGTMAAINKAKAEAEKAREIEPQEVKQGDQVPSDQAAAVATHIGELIKQYLQNAGAAASEGAQMQIYLPEQEVKSDYTKYLLIGGAVVLAVWLLKKK